jgi:hypothetical protein
MLEGKMRLILQSISRKSKGKAQKFHKMFAFFFFLLSLGKCCQTMEQGFL